MTFEEYKRQITQDILDFADESKGDFKTLEDFRDACFIEDSITGNGSGSYTFNSAEAEENIKDLIFSQDLLDMFKEYGYERVPLEKGPEFIDVAIRCFLLDECLADVEETVKEYLGIDE